MPAGPLHPSVESHLKTELVLLDTLRRRSQAQHRSQVFMTRLEAVLRLGRLVHASLTRCQASAGGKVSHVNSKVGQKGPEQIDAKDVRRLQLLVEKMTKALFTATIASDQIVQLYFFLPLHTLLLAIYGRLYTLCENIRAWVGEVTPTPMKMDTSKADEVVMAVLLDVPDELGERIERESNGPSTSHTTGASTPVPVVDMRKAKFSPPNESAASAVMAVESDKLASTPIPPTQTASSATEVSTKTAKVKAKKRKRNAMDDIFGF